MQISVSNSLLQTIIFAIIFLPAIFLFFKQRKEKEFFPLSLTSELKGLAILMVIFSHLGYFLSTNNKFLFPFSVAAGVGVDLFLFLSGYGLAVSALRKKLPPGKFYLKRLVKLLLPLWITMLIFIPIDYLILHLHYDTNTIISIALGWIKNADIFKDFNSPLWFISLIIFYYLLFPWVFNRRFPELSAVIFYLAGFLLLLINPGAISNVRRLYELHYIAFPLGVLFAALLHRLPALGVTITHWRLDSSKAALFSRWLTFGVLLFGALYFSLHSGVGAEKYVIQTISILTVLLYLSAFLLKKTEWSLLTFVGVYSYEVYLIHWPLVYRYDLIYHFLPASIATVIYLALLLALAWLLHKGVSKISDWLGF